MTFIPSGVFTQRVVTATQTNIQVGKWSLDGPYLQLTDFLAQGSDGWMPDSMLWYFIDGTKRDVDLFGGAFPDPDSFQHLSRLGTTP